MNFFRRNFHICDNHRVLITAVPVPGKVNDRDCTKTAVLYKCSICGFRIERMFNGGYTLQDFQK